MTKAARAIVCLLASWLPAGVHAQAFQCRTPQRVSVPNVAPDGPIRRMPVTGYTLALSWSPEFCKGREALAAQRFQCSGRNGYFGFVVHGLWPHGSSGSWPQWCATPRKPDPATARKALCMIPSERQIARQWAKHGACMTARPENYFNATRILYSSLRWPDFDALSHKPDLTAGEMRAMFVAANRGWREDAIGIKLSARGWVQEIRLCYDKRFYPARCDRSRFGARDDARVKIWRGL